METHEFAKNWRTSEIAEWLRSTGVDTIDPGTGKDTFKQMLTSCKRYVRTLNAFKNPDIAKGYTGQIIDMCAKMSLASQRRLLGAAFSPDTSYLIPGSVSTEDSSNEAGGLCLMFSTFNLALNYVRAAHLCQGRPTLAFDHTYKMDVKNRPHFTVNVLVWSPPLYTLCPPPPSLRSTSALTLML